MLINNEKLESRKTEMKTADFRSEITPNGRIAVPAEIAAQVPPGEQVAVVLTWGIFRHGVRQAGASSTRRTVLKTPFTNS